MCGPVAHGVFLEKPATVKIKHLTLVLSDEPLELKKKPLTSVKAEFLEDALKSGQMLDFYLMELGKALKREVRKLD